MGQAESLRTCQGQSVERDLWFSWIASVFCFPSEAQSEEWMGTLQRDRASIASVFTASQANSRDDRQAVLMDGVVTFSLFDNQCVPSSLSLSLLPQGTFDPDSFSFTAAGVEIKFAIVN